MPLAKMRALMLDHFGSDIFGALWQYKSLLAPPSHDCAFLREPAGIGGRFWLLSAGAGDRAASPRSGGHGASSLLVSPEKKNPFSLNLSLAGAPR